GSGNAAPTPHESFVGSPIIEDGFRFDHASHPPNSVMQAMAGSVANAAGLFMGRFATLTRPMAPSSGERLEKPRSRPPGSRRAAPDCRPGSSFASPARRPTPEAG